MGYDHTREERGVSMNRARVETLNVPGACLYYEVRGAGPTLLMICGGPTDTTVYAGVADRLADRYTVVTYDPRGNSRSRVDAPEDDQSIALDADDAERLLAAIGGAPAYVFGNSNGAMVGLDMVVRDPGQVRTLVAHEPPALELLPDREHNRAQAQDVYHTYRRAGAGAAMAKFMAFGGFEGGPEPAPGPPSEPSSEDLASMARTGRNIDVWLGQRFRSIASYAPDVTGLRAAPSRIVVAVGEASQGQLAHKGGLELAKRLGTDAVIFPGDHGGFSAQPVAFAETLHAVLGG